MRIEGLELKNIGVFKDAKMEFPKCPDGQAEIHIFTGVNGSGKSTILKALACGFERRVELMKILNKRLIIRSQKMIPTQKNC